MKKLSLMAAAIASVGFMASCGCDIENAKVVSHIDTASYALGLNQGSMLHQQIETLPGEKINVDAFLKGFVAAMKSDSANITMNEEECVKILQKYFGELDAIRRDEMEKEAIIARLQADSALQANKAKEGVVVTESGLQYRVITEGTGIQPTIEDTVQVLYTGRTIDGKVFDSTDLRDGQPATFPLAGNIPGFSEGVQLMKEGAKYEFLLPAELAYGERGAGPEIKPNSALFFEVELVKVLPAKKQK